MKPGMEHKGKLEEWGNKPGMLLQKLVAQIDIVQSNTMIEAINKILKYCYLYPGMATTTSEVKDVQEKAVEDFISFLEQKPELMRLEKCLAI